MKLIGIAFGVLLLTGAAPAMAASIVTNGGFEDGVTGWQFYAWGPMPVPNADIVPYDGNWVASTSCNYTCPMIQTLPTVAGQTYDLSFAYNAGDYNGPTGKPGGAELKVYWGDTLVEDVLGGRLGWQTFSIDNLVAPTNSTDLTFSAIKDDGRIGLDDVAVDHVSAVPEPATWTMFIMGFGLIGWLMRSSRARAATSQA